MEGSNGDDRFESWELADDAQDGRKSTGLKEEEGDIRMAKAGWIPRCQRFIRGPPNAAHMYSAGSRWVQNPDKERGLNAPIESGPKLSYNGTSAFPYRLAARSMIRHSKLHRRISDLRNPLHIRTRRLLFTWDVHAPEGDRLQSIDNQSVTRIEETLNRATEVLASGVDFAVGLPYKVVGELQGLVGDFWTIADALGVLADGLKTLFEDFDCGLETVGIFKRSLFQEGYGCKTSQYTQKKFEVSTSGRATRTTTVCSCSRPTHANPRNNENYQFTRGAGVGVRVSPGFLVSGTSTVCLA